MDSVDLLRRRNHIQPLVEFLKQLPCETIATRFDHLHVLSARDRYGLPFRIAIHRETGLIVMIDRFTQKGYEMFYDGHYRPLVAAFNRAPHDRIEFLEKGQAVYAYGLIQHFQGIVNLSHESQILDIGGSTGLITQQISNAFGGQATVIDPASAELEHAHARGLRVIHGFIEDWQPDRTYDLVLLCRSIEHLYEIEATFTKIRDLLSTNGLFFVDIVDFMAYCRKTGTPEAVSRVDHCFWLSFESAEQYFARLGFDVVHAFNQNVSGDWTMIGYVLRKGEVRNLPVDTMSMISEIKRIETEWHSYLRPVNVAFRTAYVAYRRLLAMRN